jgi:hypothetical protein
MFTMIQHSNVYEADAVPFYEMPGASQLVCAWPVGRHRLLVRINST